MREIVLGLQGLKFDTNQHLVQVENDRDLLRRLKTIHSMLVPHCTGAKEGYESCVDTTIFQSVECNAPGNQVWTAAVCVQEDLQWCLQSPNPKDTVHRRLESLSQQENGMVTMLQSFLIQPSSNVGSVIIGWVVQLLRSKPSPEAAAMRSSCAYNFWKDTPHDVLAEVSCHSEEFCDLYLTFLNQWVERISKENSSCEECKTLCKQFSVLAQSSPKLKDLCIQVVTSHFNFSAVLHPASSTSQYAGVWAHLMSAVDGVPMHHQF